MPIFTEDTIQQTTKMNKKKIFRTIFISLLALVILVISANYILSNYLENKISDNYVGGFHVTGKEVSVNLFLSSIKIKDALVTDSIPGERKLYIPELQVSGISYINLLFYNKYKARKIRILNPEITYISLKDTTPEEKSKASKIKLFIKKTEIFNAKVLVLQADSSMPDTIMSNKMSLDIWDLSLGEASSKYQYKDFGISRIALSIEQGVYYLPNKLYRLQTNTAHYDSKDSLFTIEKLQLLTNFSRYGIGEYAKTQQDWLHITFDKVALNQVDANRLLTDTTLNFNTLNIAYFNVITFKDRRLPFPEKPDSKLPMAMLDGLPFKIHCDSINIVDGRIEYNERAPNSTDEGRISFEGLTVHAENLSNNKELIYGKTTMHVSAKVVNQTMLNVDFVFPNAKYPEPYTTSGYLNPVEIKKFNPIIYQGTGVNIKSGLLKNLWFNFSYNNDVSTGSMIFEYEDLAVDIIDRKEKEKNVFTSFLINSFILQKDNIKGKDNFKEGKISFERDKKKAIFNYWWKSIMSGFIDTVKPS